ncbi:MAG: LPXTG cell wall anchor domain-containing protein, partial [Streptococcaceae bacterium]|nr:LPXTG cell wall anchor domain-containing protein [Streptococcaceae bacterium]
LVETAAADLIGDELVARVALPIVDEDNRHHAYLFVESKASTQYTPNFVSLAQFEQAHAGDLPLEIHLYPKMIVVPDDVPKEPEQPTETPELPETDSPKIGLLPETGEVKAFVSLIGVAVVIGVTVIWRRRKSVQ